MLERPLGYLLQHGVDGDVSSGPTDPGAAVDDDGAAVDGVGLDRLPDVGQDWQWVARNPVVGPARVVELLDLALADAGLLPLELQRSFVL